MKTQQQLAIILAIIGLAVAAFAQEPLKMKSSAALNWSESAGDKQPKPYNLTAEEQQQWAQLLNLEKQRGDALTVSVNDLLNTQPGPDSVTVHARYQSAWLALRLAQSQRGEWLARIQAAHGCPDCAVSQDGKTLISPPKAAQ